MCSPAQSNRDAGAAAGAAETTMTARSPHGRPQRCPYESTKNTLPLIQRHREALASSEDDITDPTASSLEPVVTKQRRQVKRGPGNELEKHREELIDLFWVHDLPLKEVQAIMKREHGLDVSVKVYNTQFRKWGIRKNLKRQEALELAVGQLDDSSTVSSSSSSSVFWPNNRDVEYAARIDRHLRNIKRRPGSTFPHVKFGTKVGGAGHPPRRLRGPDMLEKVESASYYFQMYITKNHEPDTWFRHCPCYGEQGNFSSHFLRGLDRLSRNEQPRQAFKDINLAFDELKDTVSWNHPMVYMRLMDAIASSGMYPKSEVCKTICRLLSDHVRRLSIIVHGPNHPLNHAWGEAMCVSGDSSESFILGVAKSLFKKCISRRGRTPVEAYDISECIPSDARDLDEETLRGSLTKPIPLSDLPKAQEARLALSELLISQDRMAEGCHYYRVAMAFQDDDPVRRAAKTFWMAELQWRTGITWGSIDTLKRALAYAEEESEAEGGDGAATDLKEEIEALLRRRLYMLAVKEKAKHVAAGHKCPAAFLELEEAPESEPSEPEEDEAELKCPAEYVRLEKPPVIETGKPKG